MHNVILLSHDAKKELHCSRSLASHLLHQGLAKITKFYPYTLQLKSPKPFDPFDEDKESVFSPNIPRNNPPRVMKRQVRVQEEVL
ncbi:MAG: hypothetical protein JSR17_02755 [Proteobacteria bacterium]|nr:hypothetical protein [Pseudomonadota bacterium]